MNTGKMASWIILFLHTSPEWKAKVVTEVTNVATQFAPGPGTPLELSKKLVHIPPEAWDEQMPILDLCLRETIRKVMTGTSLRRVARDGVVINGVNVEKDSFIAYLKSNTHMDPQLYDEPEK